MDDLCGFYARNGVIKVFIDRVADFVEDLIDPFGLVVDKIDVGIACGLLFGLFVVLMNQAGCRRLVGNVVHENRDFVGAY